MSASQSPDLLQDFRYLTANSNMQKKQQAIALLRWYHFELHFDPAFEKLVQKS